jgi:hypothetical protein
MRKLLILIVFILPFASNAQELNCKVSVLSQSIQLSDKRIFTTLETSVREFMNNRKWTSDQFKRDERIECNLTFNITKFTQPGDMSGTLQIQVRRPVFNANIGTLLMNFIDQDIAFQYIEYQPIDFADNAYVSSLSSILGYYAYVMLAMDYDSFSLEGGTQFWQKAQQTVINSQSDGGKGWKASDIPPRNRYWLTENYLNAVYKPLREANYLYHRMGMDNMYSKMDLAKTNIKEALKKIQAVNKQRPSSYNVQLFFNAKTDELINIYKQGTPAEKEEILALLAELDPTNSNKYAKINQ